MDVIGVHQRRVQGIVDGVRDTLVTLRTADIHDGYTTISQRVTHVCEVGVDIARHGDDLCDRTRGVRYDVIRLAERIEQVQLRIDLLEFLVIDDQQRIHMLGQTRYTHHGFLDLLLTLERKRNGHDTYRQDTHLLGYLGNDSRRTCTCATTHSGSEEQHLRTVVERLADMIAALLGILTSCLRITSGTQTRT